MPGQHGLADKQSLGQDLAEELKRELVIRLGGLIRRLEVVCVSDRCVLYGEATSFYTKQLAQVTAMQVANIGRLKNEIAVIAVKL